MDVVIRMVVTVLILLAPVGNGSTAARQTARWDSVVTRTNYPLPGDAGQVFRFEPRQARCIRIDATRLRSDPGDANRYRAQFAEIEVFIQNPTGEQHATVNVALGAKVIASSSFEYVGWGLDRVTDGAWDSSPDSMGWSSDSDTAIDHAETIMLALGGDYLVRSVVLYPRNDGTAVGQGFPLDFTIQMSSDEACLTP
jgi:hypothetical protein